MWTAGLLLLAVLAPQESRAEGLFDRVTFGEAQPQGEPGERVLALLKSREHWLAAARAIESRLGPWREKQTVQVSFDYDGDDAARTATIDGVGRIRFNLKKLEELQIRADELERQKRELAKEGKRLRFKVPPARLDRLLWHELTHVFHGDLDAPDWFTEGLATWLSEDLNNLHAYAAFGPAVEEIDGAVGDKMTVYARGHLFWSWVAARGGVKPVVKAVVVDRAPWKASLEKVLGLPWEEIQKAELEWSAKEVAKLRQP